MSRIRFALRKKLLNSFLIKVLTNTCDSQAKKARLSRNDTSIPIKLIVCQIMRSLFLFMFLFIFCYRISHMIVETGRNILWWQDMPKRFAKIFFRKDILRWNALSVIRNLCIVRNTIFEIRNDIRWKYLTRKKIQRVMKTKKIFTTFINGWQNLAYTCSENRKSLLSSVAVAMFRNESLSRTRNCARAVRKRNVV